MNKLKERFMKKVKVNNDTGCWEWLGFKGLNNYGQFSIGGRTVLAHRASFLIFNGDLVRGMCVCHRCDNPMCVNPVHLFQGTRSDNMQDCIKKGRRNSKGAEGVKHHRSVFADDDIRSIRNSSDTRRNLADKYGVTTSAIGQILRGVSWRHII